MGEAELHSQDQGASQRGVEGKGEGGTGRGRRGTILMTPPG